MSIPVLATNYTVLFSQVVFHLIFVYLLVVICGNTSFTRVGLELEYCLSAIHQQHKMEMKNHCQTH